MTGERSAGDGLTRRPTWPALSLLASALVVLASLYLPWQETSCASGSSLDTFGCQTADGLTSGAGKATALLALLLAAGAIFALVRPELASRLPVGRCALLTGYFALVTALEVHATTHGSGLTANGVHFHTAYGTYVGVAAGTLAVLTAGVIRRPELRRGSGLAARLLVSGLVVGLLVSLLLPWVRSGPTTLLGIGQPASVLAAIFAVCSLAAWWQDGPDRWALRLVLSAGSALLIGGAVSSETFPLVRSHEVWLALAIAVALTLLALRDVPRGVARSARLSVRTATTGIVAGLFILSLFLPWQRACYSRDSGFAGGCFSVNGWSVVGGTSAILAAVIVVVVAAPRRRAVSTAECVAAFALFVATLGLELRFTVSAGAQVGVGAFIGIGCAALLVALALSPLRTVGLDRKRVLVRLTPLAACAGYVLVVVVPWWSVLPDHLQHSLAYAQATWLTIAGVLLGIHLLGLWLRRTIDHTAATGGLVLVPLALLALAAIDLIARRHDERFWGGGIVVGLGVLLAVAGLTERRGGLQDLRIPEALRIDRL